MLQRSWIFLLLAFFCATACSSSKMMMRETSGAAAPPMAPSPGDAAGMGGMDASTTASMPEEAPPADGKRMPQGEMSSPTPEQNRPVARDDDGERAIGEPDVDPAARHIIYTAQMVVSVFNLEDAMVKAEAIPETHGGYIQAMSTGMVVLRVPSKSLRKVMDEVGEYGIVEQRAMQAQDVTAEFVDIDSRLRALEETHKQLLELLSKARTVKEALEVREALDRITGELEVLKGRMRQLQNLISYSTLALTLQERGPHTPTPSSNDPFTWVNELGVESTEWR